MATHQASGRPHYFLVRPDKTAVPLIALDEIHADYHIAGVSKTLTTEEIEKWNMARVGDLVDHPNFYYHITFQDKPLQDPPQSIATSIPVVSTLAPDTGKALFKEQQPTRGQGISTDMRPGSEAAKYFPPNIKSDVFPLGTRDSEMDATGLENAPSSIESEQDQVEDIPRPEQVPNEHPSKTKDAATPGVYGKKKFCTYWIRTGNCDYVQEGCKYLHVIPDEETRLRIGIRDMPRWAKEDLPVPDQNIFPKKNSTLAQNWRTKGPVRVSDVIDTATPRVRPTHQAKSFAGGKNHSVQDLSRSTGSAGKNHVRNNVYQQSSQPVIPSDMNFVDARQSLDDTTLAKPGVVPVMGDDHKAASTYHYLPRSAYRAPDKMPMEVGLGQNIIHQPQNRPTPGSPFGLLRSNDDGYSEVSDHSRLSNFSINRYLQEVRLPDYGSDGATSQSEMTYSHSYQNGRATNAFGAIGTGYGDARVDGSVPPHSPISVGGSSQKSDVYHPRRFARPGEPKFVVTSSRTAELMKSSPETEEVKSQRQSGRQGQRQSQNLAAKRTSELGKH